MEYKQLYRSRRDSIIGGVAGGMGQYFQIDPIIIRILFVVFAMVGGGGLLAYIILWIITPEEPVEFLNFNTDNMEKENASFETGEKNKQPDSPKFRGQGNLIGGIILITLGVLFLIERYIPRINFGDLWPVILIVIGIALLFTSVMPRTRKNEETENPEKE